MPLQLQCITTTKCPHCGCDVIVNESVETNDYCRKPEVRTHCNGGRWERRRFLCGYEVKFIPNFDREEVYNQCPHKKSEVAKRNKREKALKEAVDFLQTLDTDEEFRDRLVHRLDHALLY